MGVCLQAPRRDWNLFGLGIWELVIILVIIVIIFGVGKLPQLGEGMGKAIRGFKKGLDEPKDPSDSNNDSGDSESRGGKG